MTQVDRGAGDAPSDAELILQVRSGDREAFGALYSRHSTAALYLARQYVNHSDADDVVADAFSKLYEMLRRGAGPDSGFRTYLYTVVRHRAYDVSRGATRMRPAEHEEIEAALGRVASSEDPAIQGFERSVVSRAYFALPERWREVLWYCLVDDLRPAQVAPVLGLSAPGVSSLLYRAKDALRDGYLQQHLSHAPSDTCRAVNPHLGGYVRDSLSRREKSRIESHLTECGTCSALVLELSDVAHGMKCVVAPLLLGAAGLALVGSAIPVGGGLAAAVKAASAAGMHGASAGGGAVGGAGAGLSGVGAGAGTASSAAVGSTAVGSTAVGSAAGATAGATATGTAASVAGATAGATAVGVVGAGGAAATSGAVGAGTITVAAVGVVAALQLMGPQTEPVHEVEPAMLTAASPQIPTARPAEPTTGVSTAAPTDDGDPTQPGNLAPVLGGELGLTYVDDGPLEPRRAQDLVLTVENTGDAATTGTMVRVALPAGMSAAVSDSPSGQGAVRTVVGSDTPGPEDRERPSTTPGRSPGVTPPSGRPTEASSGVRVPTVCTPGSTPEALLCDVGAMDAGQSRQVQVTVRADSGGSYPVTAELWADGMETTSVALPAWTVAAYGPELTAQATATEIASPGRGTLAVRMGNTGDRAAPSGWSMTVSLPDGVRPAAAQQALACTGGEARTWSCAPRESAPLGPGSWRELPLSVVAVPAGARAAVKPTTGTASVSPQGVSHTLAARAEVGTTSAWSGAGQGAGKLVAQCAARGGKNAARSELVGTFTNTAARQVSVALESGGRKTARPDPVDPGQSVTVRRDEGIRVPAGKAVWVLSRTVEGVTYEHRVPAGSHQGVDCYDPDWDAEAKARPVNAAGAAGVRGTLVNRSGEPMDVTMVAQVGSGQFTSSAKSVPPGESRDFIVATGQSRIDAGSVSFQLRRWTTDRDGDAPAGAAKPSTAPRATYGSAVVAPSYPDWPRPMSTPCTYDADRGASVGTFRVPVDNTASTLPVTFRLGEASRTVAAGEKAVLETTVPWGTDELPLLIGGGRSLGQVDVAFSSCAEVTWPQDEVTSSVEARCDDGAASVVAEVRNRGEVSWTGRLHLPRGGQFSDEVDVPAGQDTRIELTDAVLRGRERPVELWLSRQFEGERHTVRQSHTVRAATCDPSTNCTGDSTAAGWITSLFGSGCDEGDPAVTDQGTPRESATPGREDPTDQTTP